MNGRHKHTGQESCRACDRKRPPEWARCSRGNKLGQILESPGPYLHPGRRCPPASLGRGKGRERSWAEHEEGEESGSAVEAGLGWGTPHPRLRAVVFTVNYCIPPKIISKTPPHTFLILWIFLNTLWYPLSRINQEFYLVLFSWSLSISYTKFYPNIFFTLESFPDYHISCIKNMYTKRNGKF